jgi:hypothetical protein
LNEHSGSDVRQIEVLTAELLVHGPSRLEFEIAIAERKKYKWSGCDEIPAELIQAGGEILLSAIHKFDNSVWYKEELPHQWKESITISETRHCFRLQVVPTQGGPIVRTTFYLRTPATTPYWCPTCPIHLILIDIITLIMFSESAIVRHEMGQTSKFHVYLTHLNPKQLH